MIKIAKLTQKILCGICTISIMCSLSITGYAATDLAGRIENLCANFNITSIEADADDNESSKNHAATYTSEAVTAIEEAIDLVGSKSIKHIIQFYIDDSKTSRFKIQILDTRSVIWAGSFASNGVLKLYVDEDGSRFSSGTVIHEFMHAADRGILKNKGSEVMTSLNGDYSGFTDTTEYVRAYAATNAGEDFAVTATEMITCGGSKPFRGDQNSLLYKKYRAVHEILVAHFGAESNVALRSAAYLGGFMIEKNPEENSSRVRTPAPPKSNPPPNDGVTITGNTPQIIVIEIVS